MNFLKILLWKLTRKKEDDIPIEVRINNANYEAYKKCLESDIDTLSTFFTRALLLIGICIGILIILS